MLPSPLAPRIGAHRCRVADVTATLRWTEWGPVDGPPVVCVHGLTRTGRDFDALARALAGRGRRVICPDIFGRGLSDWLPRSELYTVPHYALALGPVLAALGRPCDWVGTSMGGLIGMALAASPGPPLRRLVLNDVGPVLPGAALARIGAYVGQPREFDDLAGVEAYLRAVHAPFGDLGDEGWRHLAATSARTTAAGRTVLHYDLAIAAPFAALPPGDQEMWDLWSMLTVPTRVLRGEASDLLSADVAERMTRRPGVDLVTFARCGHAPALMAPEQVAAVVDFLA